MNQCFSAEQETQHAVQAAAATVGTENLDLEQAPSTGSEDFAFMPQRKPSCYVFLGGRRGNEKKRLHSATYDFNDEILAIGASYWARLVEGLSPPDDR